jgi:hypothetical protein
MQAYAIDSPVQLKRHLYMTFDQIHSLLISEFGLVPDLLKKGNGCSYFFGQVNKGPETTTRIIRVHHDALNLVSEVKRSVSSGSANSVFIEEPITLEKLRTEVAEELVIFLREKYLFPTQN